MKKIYIAAAMVVSFCLIITAVTRTAAGNFTEVKPVSATEEPARVVESDEESTVGENVYILTEKNGRIVVYKQGQNVPFQITDTYLRDLPEFDREKIEMGIEIRGDTALRRAIEDYCS